jgi:hypothetical protein
MDSTSSLKKTKFLRGLYGKVYEMDKRVYVIGFLVFSVFILSFNIAITFTKAEKTQISVYESNPSLSINFQTDKDGDMIDDSIEDKNKRTINVTMEASEIIIESIKRSESKKDEIRTEISYGTEGISIQTRYRSNLEGDFGSNSIISFRKIVEFVDINFNGIYDPEIDNAIKNYTLDSFSPATQDDQSISSDTIFSNVKIQTVDKNFTVNFYFVEEFTVIEKSLVSPIQTKLDVEFSEFKFLYSNSSLALLLNLEGEDVFKKIDKTEDEILGLSMNEEGVKSSFEGKDGYLTWDLNASIEDKSVKISASDLLIDPESENVQIMYLSYLRGEIIQHEFKIGIEGLLIMTNLISPEQILLLVVVIGAVSVIAYSIYNYKTNVKRKLINEYPKIKTENQFDAKIALELLQEENAIITLQDRGDINITAVAEDFYDTVKMLRLKGEDNYLFIREMLALSPYEREVIIRDMLLNIE